MIKVFSIEEIVQASNNILKAKKNDNPKTVKKNDLKDTSKQIPKNTQQIIEDAEIFSINKTKIIYYK